MTTKRRIAALLILVVLGAGAFAKDASKLLPVDEADRDTTLVAFRDRLLQAVTKRDPDFLRGIVGEGIVNGLKASVGRAEFERRWQVASPDSEVWSALQTILSMGGGFVRSERGVKFCAPYVFTDFPDNLDIYGYGAITASDAVLKARPRRDGATIKALSYDIVKVNDWRSVPDAGGGAEAWIKVTTLDGKDGYVETRVVRSPTDYHACFTKMRNDWEMTSLISGD